MAKRNYQGKMFVETKGVPKTVVGGPSIVCGEYIFGGETNNIKLAEHFVEKHGIGALSHQIVIRISQLTKLQPAELFDRSEYLR